MSEEICLLVSKEALFIFPFAHTFKVLLFMVVAVSIAFMSAAALLLSENQRGVTKSRSDSSTVRASERKYLIRLDWLVEPIKQIWCIKRPTNGLVDPRGS